VDWQAALRRWSDDYDQTASNTAVTHLEPRGLPALETSLARTRLRCAATGAFAAQRFEPIAPARTAALYVEDANEAADRLGLREADAGANVVLLEPFDPVVFDRNINGWVAIPEDMELPDNQQDRDMIAREMLIKFQMSPDHPLVDLYRAYRKF